MVFAGAAKEWRQNKLRHIIFYDESTSGVLIINKTLEIDLLATFNLST